MNSCYIDTHLFYKKQTAFQKMAPCRSDAATTDPMAFQNSFI